MPKPSPTSDPARTRLRSVRRSKRSRSIATVAAVPAVPMPEWTSCAVAGVTSCVSYAFEEPSCDPA